MKFGVMIRGQYPQGDDMRARLREDLDFARRAEALGYDSILKGSHYSSHPFQSVQQIPFLAQVAALCPRLRIIAGVVLLPLHKPLDLAEQLATLDIMSDGKFVFGIGLGYREVEFQAFGTTQKAAPARLEECLATIRRLWAEEFVTMEGSHFRLEGANCTVKPVQHPGPPVWYGANADAGIRRAARVADCWYINPHSTIATITRQLDIYKRALDAAGKPMPAELPIMREVYVAPTREEAIRRARPAIETKYAAYRAWGQDKVMPAGDDFDRDFDSLIEDRFLFGSPAEVTEQVLALKHRLGVNYVVFGSHWPGMSFAQSVEQITILAEEVIPAVAQG